MTADSPESPSPELSAEALSAIDRSCRLPVIALAGAAVKWLIAGLLVLTVASFQLFFTDLFSSLSWLTHGRLQAAGMNMVVYGFGIQAGLAAMVWILARLGQNAWCGSGWILSGGALWNVGLAAGILGILAGDSTGFELLEIPRYGGVTMFAGFFLETVGILIFFHGRRVRELYLSQWMIFCALLWFAWNFSAAQIAMSLWPVKGAAMAAVHGWYVFNLLGLWFVPVALAIIFYFVPKAAGRPVSFYLGAYGFWLLALVTPWTGMAYYIFGPLPAWYVSLSVVASVMGLVPLLSFAANYYQTVAGDGKCRLAGTGFFRAGFIAYLLFAVLLIATSLRSVASFVHFSLLWRGEVFLLLFGVAGLTFFGAIYEIVPRVLGMGWHCNRFATIHLRLQLAAVAIFLVSLGVGGVVQGIAWNNPALPSARVVQMTSPFLKVQTLGLLLLLVSHLMFAGFFGRQLFRFAWGACPWRQWLETDAPANQPEAAS